MTLTEALFKLRDAGKLHVVYRPGMLYRTYKGFKRIGDGGIVFVSDLRQWEPDLTDPATLGCLLALIREAVSDAGLSVQCRSTLPASIPPWVVQPRFYSAANPGPWGEEPLPTGHTEGEALTAAIVRIAEGL